jgi:hypothetical protein
MGTTSLCRNALGDAFFEASGFCAVTGPCVSTEHTLIRGIPQCHDDPDATVVAGMDLAADMVLRAMG